jgi:hypothetical protein
MSRAHRLVGLIGILAFLATGVYMRRSFPGKPDLDSGTRMFFRSRHIYLLLASLLNLGLGTYSSPSAVRWRRILQVVGSCLILAAPPLLLIAFAHEPTRSDRHIPWSRPAIIALFAGTLLHAFAGRGGRAVTG